VAIRANTVSLLLSVAAIFFGLQSPASSQGGVRVATGSRVERGGILATVLALRDAVIRGDGRSMARHLGDGYVEDGLVAGKAEALVIFADVLARAAVRDSSQMVTKPASTDGGLAPITPLWDFDLTDVEIMVEPGDERASVSCRVVFHALASGASSRADDTHDVQGHDFTLELERNGHYWKVASSNGFLRSLVEAVEAMEEEARSAD
jgi:hypothetical protein